MYCSYIIHRGTATTTTTTATTTTNDDDDDDDPIALDTRVYFLVNNRQECIYVHRGGKLYTKIERRARCRRYRNVKLVY